MEEETEVDLDLIVVEEAGLVRLGVVGEAEDILADNLVEVRFVAIGLATEAVSLRISTGVVVVEVEGGHSVTIKATRAIRLRADMDVAEIWGMGVIIALTIKISQTALHTGVLIRKRNIAARSRISRLSGSRFKILIGDGVISLI
jgi:hypothetical protein